MADKKTAINNIQGVTQMEKTEGVIYFKANKPLTMTEHKSLHEKIEYEMQKTGLKIVLVPFLVDMDKTNEC